MSKTILVYANCLNRTARGDFSFAGSIARDLAKEIERDALDIKVVLTSTMDGMTRLESLYPKLDEKHVMIDGITVGICSLELFDGVEHSVVAFIEANRCKYAPVDIIKRVLSPESKFLFIGAANQNALSSLKFQHLYHKMVMSDQPDLYSSFHVEDMFFGASGLGADRKGLPEITPASKMLALNPSQQELFPTTRYGFMYLAATGRDTDYQLITQYIKLTGLNEYRITGAFADKNSSISEAYHKDNSLTVPKKEFPHIVYHSSLEYPLMRQTVANASTDLIASTGVMSTLEVMADNKLPFYQDLEINSDFVASYLWAVQSIITSDVGLMGAMPKLIIDLSVLLFAPKPFNRNQMEETNTLLKMPSVCNRLKEVNQTVLAKANGTLAPALLRFIGTPRKTNDFEQLTEVCFSLRKIGETVNPVHDQALRRAAAWGRLFELKVIIKSMSSSELSKQDTSVERTALHWAILHQHVDCIRALIKNGTNLNTQDAHGKTALHYAVEKGDRTCIRLLIDAGAAQDIPDKKSRNPKDCANTVETRLFMENFLTQHSTLSPPMDGSLYLSKGPRLS